MVHRVIFKANKNSSGLKLDHRNLQKFVNYAVVISKLATISTNPTYNLKILLGALIFGGITTSINPFHTKGIP